MIPIQRAYSGLLDLLAAKVYGRVPPNFEEALRGTLNVKPLLGQVEDIRDNPVSQVTVNGGARVMVVPQNEWWLVHAAAGYMTHGAAVGTMCASIRVRVNQNSGLNGSSVAVRHSGVFTAATADATIVEWAPVEPYLLPPGTEIGCWLDFLSVASVGLQFRARVVRLT